MLNKLMPARAELKEDRMVADLDALVSEPVTFRLHGKLRELKPVTTEEFFKFTVAYNTFLDLNKKKEIGPDETVDRFYDLMRTLCDDVTRDDIKQMTQTQMGAIFGLLIDTTTGRVFESDDNMSKKKGWTRLQDLKKSV